MNFANLALAAVHFHALRKDMDAIGPAIIRKACKMVFDEVRRVLGTEGYSWTALSPNTKKTQPGMLLESGELRASIQWTSKGLEGSVGSDLDKAVFHELGTSRIPARSFLRGAAQAMEGKIHKMAVAAVKSVMAGSSLHGSHEMTELIHALKHLAEEVKEGAHDVLEGGDEKGILK